MRVTARPKHAEAMYGEASDESGGGGSAGGERDEGGEGCEGGEGGERDEGGEGGEGGPALLATPGEGCRAEPPPYDPA